MIFDRYAVGALRRRIKRLSVRWSDHSVTPETGLTINVTLLTGRAKQSAIICTIGITVAISVFLSFKNHFNYYLMDSGFGAVCAFYLMLIYQSLRWLRMPNRPAQFQRAMRGFIGLLFCLGAAWGLVLITTIRAGDANQRALIYPLAIGLISTMMISGPIRYALAFWIPVTTGAFLALIIDRTHMNFAIIIALTFYGMLSLYAIISVNKKMFERELNIHKIKAHSDTISLFLKDFQEGTGSFVWETDAAGEVRTARSSKSFDLLCYYDKRLTNINDVLSAISSTDLYSYHVADEAPVSQIAERMAVLKPFRDSVLCVFTKIGPRWWSLSGKPVFDTADQFDGYRGVCTDVTERETYKQKIELNAERDYLTGIYNRAAFNRIFQSFCANADTKEVALLCLDLDHFKAINDNFGHVAGDSLLLAVVERLKICTRAQDLLFRLGGDEFAILVPGGGVAQASLIAQRIVEVMAEPFPIVQASLKISVSVGVALVPNQGNQPDLLHRKADIALYRAKAHGRGRFVVYDRDLDQQLEYEQALEVELTYALERDQFVVVFQPIVDLQSRRIVGAEALLRWTHPRFGAVAPVNFIPYLEKGNQIAATGLFVIAKAIRVAAQMPVDIVIAINLSSVQLSDVKMPDKIATLLAQNAVPSGQIEFEITESSLLQKDVQKLAVLREIQALGCRIAVDDFGTDYSSLRLLDEFEFDKIKIDASFIKGLHLGSRRRLILESIIELGAKLELLITGEGIETEAQKEQLTGLGCVQGQGFLFYRPMAEAQFLGLFEGEERAGLSEEQTAEFE
jgi:diguanylate cyclase (GGDEF)-like protein